MKALLAAIVRSIVIAVSANGLAFAIQTSTTTSLPKEPVVDASAYLMIDANSGKVLVSKGGDDKLPIASLTKIMTLYLVNQALQAGTLHWDDKITVSEKAWKTGGSRMFIQVGTQVSVSDLVQGVVVASGNDAAIALSEQIAGSEQAFVDLMNQQAQKLGMQSTHFINVTGLPGVDEYSTVHDLGVLTRALIKDFPQNYAWYGQKWFTYNAIKQPNRNRLLWQYENADGLKTGFTADAHYCLIASAMKNNMRLIVIILGASSDRSRTEGAKSLFAYGFRFFETVQLHEANMPITQARVYYGKNPTVNLGLRDDLHITTLNGQSNKLKTVLELTPLLRAPIEKGAVYGKMIVTLDNQPLQEVDLIALDNDPRGSWWTRIVDFIALLWHRLVTRL